MRAELGAAQLELFDNFETKASAAASLGQVHRACLKSSGRPGAVKAQYPGIAETIEQDLHNLKPSASRCASVAIGRTCSSSSTVSG